MAYSPVENKFLSALTAVQFPTEPVEPEMAQPDALPEPVQVAQAGGGMPEIRPTPRNKAMGGVADFVRGVRDLANQYEIKDFVPLLGGMGVGDLLLGKSPEELEEWAYGNAPMRIPEMSNVPIVKTGRKEQLADAAFLGFDATGLTKGAAVAGRAAAKGAIAAGRAGEKLAEKTVPQIMEKGGTMAELMQALSQGSRSQLMAYHGSPYEFNKFSAKKIGSGEGAQAYGFGMYFAEDKGVAQGYHTSLSMKVAHVDGKMPERNTLEWEAANSIASKGYDQALAQAKKSSEFRLVTPEGREKYQQLVKVIEGMKGRKVEDKASGGVYTVDIPDLMVSKMLDFDAPIGEQSPEIQALAKQYNLSIADLGGDLLAAADGKTPAGAQKLREAGVPGVRYLDQGSRSSKASTRNIVVFPGGEDQVKILKQEGKK